MQPALIIIVLNSHYCVRFSIEVLKWDRAAIVHMIMTSYLINYNNMQFKDRSSSCKVFASILDQEVHACLVNIYI